LSGISVQDGRLKALQEEQKQIESNLQLLGRAETGAGLDFFNQLTTAKLLLEIEISDSSFRLDRLREFLGGNSKPWMLPRAALPFDDSAE